MRVKWGTASLVLRDNLGMPVAWRWRIWLESPSLSNIGPKILKVCGSGSRVGVGRGPVQVWRPQRTEPGHPCCCMGTHVWLLGAERLGDESSKDGEEVVVGVWGACQVRNPAGNPKGCVNWVGGSSAGLTHLTWPPFPFAPFQHFTGQRKSSSPEGSMGVLGCLNWFCEENPFRGVGCSYRQVISYFILNVVYPFTVFFLLSG